MGLGLELYDILWCRRAALSPEISENCILGTLIVVVVRYSKTVCGYLGTLTLRAG